MTASSRGRPLFAVALALVLVVAVLPGIAAAETRTGGSVVVESGETVNGNLQVFAGTVVVRGTVDGDLQGVAGSVVVEGTVTGDVEVSGGSLQILGTVEGDVRTSAGSVSIGPDAVVSGTVEAAAGSVRVDGDVGGDLVSAAEQTTLGSTASVGGDLRYGGDLDRADGATVAGSVTFDDDISVNAGAWDFSAPTIGGWGFTFYIALVNVVFGAVLLAVFPRFGRTIADGVAHSPLRSGGLGLLALVGVPVVLVLLAITIVGIPLTLMGIFVYVLALWLGYVYGAFAVGSWLLDLADVATNRYVALVLGVLLVAVIGMVPWLGGFVEFLVLLLGLGALGFALWRTYRDRREGGEESGEEAAAA